MSASDEVARLPGGDAVAALAARVRGNPDAIRDIASRWSEAAGDCAAHARAVKAAVADVTQDWQGASATAFAAFMGRFGAAGQAAERNLSAAARTLHGVAGTLEEAHVGIERICENLLGEVARLRAANPDLTPVQLGEQISGLTQEAAGAARVKAAQAEQELGRAQQALSADLSRLNRTFSALPEAGTASFTQGWATPAGWRPRPHGSTPRTGSGGAVTRSTAGGGAGAGGGTGDGTPAPAVPGGTPAPAGSGSLDGLPVAAGGAAHTVAGVHLGGPAPGGPAAPHQVNGWINQAVKVLEARGVPASKLSPQDIWIIIQHESGGNPDVVNTWDSNAAAGTPSIGLMQCVPLSTLILTSRGWLSHDQVRVGDQTIGYNPDSGRAEWTPVRRVVRYAGGVVWRIGNKHWHADVTPNHRWWSDTRQVRKAETMTQCPECGYASSPRGVSTHRGRVHGIRGVPTLGYRGEFVRTDRLSSGHRLRLAAPAATEGVPGLSPDEVRIIARLQGDGHIGPLLAEPVPWTELGMEPGYVRVPAPARAAGSLAVRGARDSGATTARAHGDPAGYDGAAAEAPPSGIVHGGALVTGIDHEGPAGRRGATSPANRAGLRRSFLADLLKRSGLMETGPERFVLALSPGQRAAWLDSMIGAVGHDRRANPPLRAGLPRVARARGPLHDALKLAVYLEGYLPTVASASAERDGDRAAGVVGMAGAHVAPSMFDAPRVRGRQPVWCVKTDLETWTAGQDGQIFLTGNTIGPTFNAYALPGHGNIYNPVDNIIAGVRYALARYGSLDNVPGVAAVHEGRPYVGY